MSTSRHGQSTRQCNIYSQVSQSAVRHSRPKYHRNNRRISAQCPPHSQTQEMRHLLACSSADALFFTNKRPTMDRQTTYSSIHKSLVSKRIQYNKHSGIWPITRMHRQSVSIDFCTVQLTTLRWKLHYDYYRKQGIQNSEETSLICDPVQHACICRTVVEYVDQHAGWAWLIGLTSH